MCKFVLGHFITHITDFVPRQNQYRFRYKPLYHLLSEPYNHIGINDTRPPDDNIRIWSSRKA